MYFEQELSVHVHDMEIPKSFSNKKRVYAFDRIVEVMHDLPELKDAFSHLDYVSSRSYLDPDLSLDDNLEFDHVEAIVNTGGNEGIYIDCKLILYDVKSRSCVKRDFGTLKTLNEGITGYMEMGKLAGAFTYVAELYFLLNGSLFAK